MIVEEKKSAAINRIKDLLSIALCITYEGELPILSPKK